MYVWHRVLKAQLVRLGLQDRLRFLEEDGNKAGNGVASGDGRKSSTMVHGFRDVSGCVAIITGANCGVGRQTARSLALLGAHVVLACRSAERAADAVKEIQQAIDDQPVAVSSSGPSATATTTTPSTAEAKGGALAHAKGSVTFLQLDLTNFASIDAFASAFRLRFSDRLDILINNAGINTRGVTASGLQETFVANFLGHYYLFSLLQPLLSDATHSKEPARVVNLSSVMHHVGGTDFLASAYSQTGRIPNISVASTSDSTRTSRSNMDGTACRPDEYSDSKLFMNLLTIDINRRFARNRPLVQSAPTAAAAGPEVQATEAVAETEGAPGQADAASVTAREWRPIVSVSVNPGAVRSEIWRAVPAAVLWLYDLLIMRVFYLSSEQGAATSLHACLAPREEVFSDAFMDRAYDELAGGDVEAGGRFSGHSLLPYISPYQSALIDLNNNYRSVPVTSPSPSAAGDAVPCAVPLPEWSAGRPRRQRMHSLMLEVVGFFTGSPRCRPTSRTSSSCSDASSGSSSTEEGKMAVSPAVFCCWSPASVPDRACALARDLVLLSERIVDKHHRQHEYETE
jgi:NAD(P)-dependent dehydrogenase (short-subunit alcohol dehydrogenase family)